MFDIYNLCVDRYDQDIFSDRGLQELAIYAKRRLVQKNINGEYDILIAILTPPLGEFSDLRGDIFEESGLQKAKTFGKNVVEDNYLLKVRSFEAVAAISFTGGKISEEYIEIFPRGLAPYNRMTDDNAVDLMTHTVDMSTKYSAQLGVEFMNDFISLKAARTTKRSAQQEVMGDVTDDIVDKNIKRKALTMALSKILFYLCYKFVDQPAEVKAILKMSILTKRQHHSQYTVTVTGTVDPIDTMMVNNKIKSTANFVFHNLSGVSLLFCLGIEEETTCLDGVMVGPNDTVSRAFADLGHEGDFVLKVTNISPNIAASYSVEIVSPVS